MLFKFKKHEKLWFVKNGSLLHTSAKESEVKLCAELVMTGLLL
jgi:hypothetical protein